LTLLLWLLSRLRRFVPRGDSPNVYAMLLLVLCTVV
jgi:hypothetical protein